MIKPHIKKIRGMYNCRSDCPYVSAYAQTPREAYDRWLNELNKGDDA